MSFLDAANDRPVGGLEQSVLEYSVIGDVLDLATKPLVPNRSNVDEHSVWHVRKLISSDVHHKVAALKPSVSPVGPSSDHVVKRFKTLFDQECSQQWTDNSTCPFREAIKQAIV